MLIRLLVEETVLCIQTCLIIADPSTLVISAGSANINHLILLNPSLKRENFDEELFILPEAAETYSECLKKVDSSQNLPL